MFIVTAEEKGCRLRCEAPEPQMLEKIAISRKHAGEGRVMDADVAISKIKEKYGL